MGAASLAAALEKGATGLMSLDLGWDKVGDAGALSLAAALRNNHTLQRLYLHDAAIGAAGIQALATALDANQTLTTLDIDGGGVEGDMEVAALYLSAIEAKLTRNKAAPPRPPKPPPKVPEPAELLPATAGSRASQAAHRRLERMRVGR